MKTATKILFTLICLFIFQFTAFAQKQEVLLIGTFHFANPNLDAVQTIDFNILGDQSQKELENITNQIKKFNPDQIFVEWPATDQEKLDSLYQMYVNGNYQSYIKEKYQHTKQFASYNEDETFQLAFRAGKKTGLGKIYGIDYQMSLPFDTVMKAIESAKQTDLMNDISLFLKISTDEANLQRKTLGVTEIILNMNTPEFRAKNAGFYLQTINKAGSKESFAGAYSVSEWYRRNLYMYSLVQKLTKSTDKRIVILLGAGHAAMIKQFIALENKFKIVELKDLLK
ncbi:hypothetical protein GJU39_05355 [Pedobacter petrophilus]|uniref:TraB/GumN family protein n=1 Tax=Pedobacter petrophilus TaxID=1908241 RepID=A0A7K0FVX8_9SPHI|nr:DUF5694 domain-containing protein [Pedobacter petrophilus]MRX75512.1 hypothetical protein [Pedobacter petrophilus]